jgi:hypothetical protein
MSSTSISFVLTSVRCKDYCSAILTDLTLLLSAATDNNNICWKEITRWRPVFFIWIRWPENLTKLPSLRRDFSKVQDFSRKPGLLAFKIRSLSAVPGLFI